MSQYLRIWRCVAKNTEPMTKDAIGAALAMERGILSPLLSQMARSGYLKRVSGQRFQAGHSPAGVTIDDCKAIAKAHSLPKVKP